MQPVRTPAAMVRTERRQLRPVAGDRHGANEHPSRATRRSCASPARTTLPIYSAKRFTEASVGRVASAVEDGAVPVAAELAGGWRDPVARPARPAGLGRARGP